MNWGDLMKNANAHFGGASFGGLQLATGLSLFYQGCKEDVFKVTNLHGMSCSYKTVVNFLKKSGTDTATEVPNIPSRA